MRARDILPINDNADPGDIKAWSLGWLIPICEVLTVAGEEIPEDWGFSPSPMVRTLDDYRYDSADDFQAVEVLWEYEQRGADGLLYVGRVLNRYFDMFVAGTERDY